MLLALGFVFGVLLIGRIVRPNKPNDQKQTIYFLNARKCQSVSGHSCPNANRELAFEDCTFDHIKEYDDGGKTTVDNGQILCRDCHNYKTQQYRTKLKRQKCDS